jgi:hypothetical protein
MGSGHGGSWGRPVPSSLLIKADLLKPVGSLGAYSAEFHKIDARIIALSNHQALETCMELIIELLFPFSLSKP